ncbi:MAG: peptidoglycan-associated lipoprotein Pal [Alphaproteobacteria bacterium]|nr:peptidoglycan-associated lipoprotein Pal [Alphaproteobacteria bacterium]
MKLVAKSLAVVSALFLLAACESGTTGSGGAGGSGSPATPGTQEDLTQNVGDRVFFDTDSSTLSAEAQDTLSKQVEWLKQYSNVNVTVEGHCDERGTREYNIALGERRAAVTKRYLLDKGIAAGRISTISYGKERPAVVGSDESAWSQNRRSVSVVSNQ